ncbi:uncharacterized protein VTP21DRAFT_9102 [Calcarisporiella thermophila]|uniref:uncharacterized protein n=1 Tax=Calcarisporiella thermophila TaxID=911321 RepID=UPI00374350F7
MEDDELDDFLYGEKDTGINTEDQLDDSIVNPPDDVPILEEEQDEKNVAEEEEEESESDVEIIINNDDAKPTAKGSLMNIRPNLFSRPQTTEAASPNGQEENAQTVQKKSGGIDLETPGTWNGQSILEVDPESFEDKPWRKPGADISDYFNFGFNEVTWRIYCQKQKQIREERGNQRKINVYESQPDIPDMFAEMQAIQPVPMDFPPTGMGNAPQRGRGGFSPSPNRGGVAPVRRGREQGEGAIQVVSSEREAALEEIHPPMPIRGNNPMVEQFPMDERGFGFDGPPMNMGMFPPNMAHRLGPPPHFFMGGPPDIGRPMHPPMGFDPAGFQGRPPPHHMRGGPPMPPHMIQPRPGGGGAGGPGPGPGPVNVGGQQPGGGGWRPPPGANAGGGGIPYSPNQGPVPSPGGPPSQQQQQQQHQQHQQHPPMPANYRGGERPDRGDRERDRDRNERDRDREREREEKERDRDRDRRDRSMERGYGRDYDRDRSNRKRPHAEDEYQRSKRRY